MNPEAMKPYGLALLDFYNGDTEATILACRDDGLVDQMPANIFFRKGTDIYIDKIALDNCRGHVLDVGAGTGLHSLYLQKQGLSVCAIDISSEACDIMRKQGLKDVHYADIFDFRADPFDTILILGRSIGLAGNLLGLDRFLEYIQGLVKPDGQILLNSLDVRHHSNLLHLAYHEANRQAGRYVGEIRLYFEYKGLKGLSFEFLHVDSETLAKHASKAGWDCEILVQEEDSNYLARLTKTKK